MKVCFKTELVNLAGRGMEFIEFESDKFDNISAEYHSRCNIKSG